MARKLSAYNKHVKQFAKSYKGSHKKMMQAAAAAWKSGSKKSHKKTRSHKRRSHRKSRK